LKHFISYRRALEKYPDCYIEITDLPIDKNFPNYEKVPVATYPAIRIWSDKEAYLNRDTDRDCIESYWLHMED
jgi:hypothetical protein